ncbi:hypothetical protein GCM10023187_24000 [Nibrella viscosa]|uniref:5'-Nucleotidase C-terminal domain-containing protein n=1 Tax=Nibrella viscosa TaxID=1084524 RepID=A0ABP8KFX5_9BACT
MRIKQLYILVLTAALSACQHTYYPTGRTYNRIEVDATAQADTGMAEFLQPYRQKLDQTMNEVLVRSDVALEKGKPESAVNNLLADALRQEAGKRYGKPIDIGHLNYSGIRSGLPKGPITVGNIYEVMPFDNQITVLTMKGSQVMQLLNHFLKDEALVISGLRATIANDKVQSVTMATGKPLQPDETYTVAMSDYVANGGSGASFLKDAVRREDLNVNIRDAFIDYFRQLGKSGQPINPTTDGRITIQ